eukprot:4276342-Amphidinium_carterae.1
MPVGTSKDDVRKVLRLLLAPYAKLPYRKSAVSAHFMPNRSKSGIESVAKTVLSPVGASLQLSKGLGAEAGFQASKVWSLCGDFSKQDSSRVPLHLVVSFAPSEALLVTKPPSRQGSPPEPVGKQSEVSHRSSASTFIQGMLPHARFQRPLQSSSMELVLPGTHCVKVGGDLRISCRPPHRP